MISYIWTIFNKASTIITLISMYCDCISLFLYRIIDDQLFVVYDMAVPLLALFMLLIIQNRCSHNKCSRTMSCSISASTIPSSQKYPRSSATSPKRLTSRYSKAPQVNTSQTTGTNCSSLSPNSSSRRTSLTQRRSSSSGRGSLKPSTRTYWSCRTMNRYERILRK